MKTLKINFILAVLLTVSATAAVTAQVTIGANQVPQNFSVLELISGTDKGLRLPQLTTAQRNALQATFGSEKTGKAMGLQIFNTTTKCVETWNGAEWIQQCYNNTPAPPPVSPSPPANCGITASNGNKTFTAKEDPNTEAYEFFIGTTSQGEQSTNSITFAAAQTPANVTVAYLYPPAFLKPVMKDIPGNGGSTTWYYGEPPGTPTTVSIPNFKMSETPVTQAQFSAVMNGATPYYFTCGGGGASFGSIDYRPTSALPVERVSWYDAIAYCNKLSIIEGKTPVYSVSVVSDWAALTYDQIPTSYNLDWNAATCNFSANGYRLPTESEWEYAARGGTANAHPVFSGSAYTYAGSFSNTQAAKDSLNLVGWNAHNMGPYYATVAPFYGTQPIKNKKPNELGLYDMSGNVWEWCWNWYNETFPMATPSGNVASIGYNDRVIRGGSWNNTSTDCRVSVHYSYGLNDRIYSIGFRVAAP